jgi:maltose-binding protein MalE
MVVDPLSADTMIVLIKELGFPIAAFVIAISVVIYMIKKNESRQKTSDIRYDKLVDQFIITTENISDDNKQFVDTIAKEIKDMTVAVSIVSVKIDNISKSIEEKFEAKSPFFVFKDKEDYDKYIKEMKR